MPEPSYLLLVFASVFFISDPFANIPIFSGFLQRLPLDERQKIIKQSHLIAIAAFFLFSFFGPTIFAYLNIQLSSFKIAGGILLLLISLEMLFGFKTRTEITEKEQEQAEEKENLAITPLAIPLITGPGAITAGIVLFSRAQSAVQVFEFTIASIAAFVLGLILMLSSEKITKIFGPIGMKIATRIMGLLLMSLAVQFIINGIRESGLLIFA